MTRTLVRLKGIELNYLKSIIGIVSISAFFTSCLPTGNNTKPVAPNQDNDVKDSPPTVGDTSDPSGTAFIAEQIVRPKVSAFSLDDQAFAVVRLALGLQTFLDSESPTLNFKLPKKADYVEIIRCHKDAKLSLGVEPIELNDLEIAGLSSSKRAQIYRSNDYFKAAENNQKCTLLSDGMIGEVYIDSFCPSGDHRYLVRACVGKTRLINTENLTGRNCSRQVAISSPLLDYRNKRKEKEVKALQLMNYYSARIDTTTAAMRDLGEEAITELETCSEKNRQRLIDKKIRDAWLTIAAVVIEVGFELKTIPAKGFGIFKYYGNFKSKQSLLDLAQLVAAGQGVMLASTLIQLAGTADDMPRTCARYKRILEEYSIAESQLALHALNYMYYVDLSGVIAKTGQAVVDGQPVSIPKFENLRTFQQ